ncbi:conserved hypothetical protein [Ricinus communis]|uniref:Uncharacterized protein n=1 Tax=Ricinus communis TaxID=3988 RepID=B9TGR1_RICCO|nr:conserved hypothetical protein [Ricinus communis]
MNGIATQWCHRDIDVVADIGPIAEQLQLDDLARTLHLHAVHAFGSRSKRLLPERLLAGNHEDDIVRHQPEDRGRIALLARIGPYFHDFADCLFIVGHSENSSMYNAEGRRFWRCYRGRRQSAFVPTAKTTT